jgi:hypothetical protein
LRQGWDLNSRAVLVEPGLLLDEELVDAGEGDVQLHQLLILVEQAVESVVEVEPQLAGLVLSGTFFFIVLFWLQLSLIFVIRFSRICISKRN